MNEMTDAYVKLDKVSKIYGTKEEKTVPLRLKKCDKGICYLQEISVKCFCPAGIAFLKTLGYNLTERVKNSPLIKKGDFENESNTYYRYR